MGNKVKDINIKNRAYSFLNDFSSTENFNVNNIKIDEKSYKNLFIYYIGFVTVKNDLKVFSVNPLYLICNKINGYFEEINGSKYLMLIPTNENKEKIKKHKALWNKIKYLIGKITENSDDYDEKYMKIKFDTDNKLTLNKVIKFPIITIVLRAVFHENNKYYPQVFVDECLYEI